MAVADQAPQIVGILRIPPDGGVAVKLASDDDVPTCALLRAIMQALTGQRTNVGA